MSYIDDITYIMLSETLIILKKYKGLQNITLGKYHFETGE
jgi:hypothetical protein